MKSTILFIYLIFILSGIVTSSFAYPDEVVVGDPLILTPLIDQHRTKEARNQSKVYLGGIESYSGYLTVNTQFHSNLFFWFFPAKSVTNNTKLILWIDGELSRSSLISLFIENGPFQIDLGGQIINRKLSWNTYQHILYIDSPVGTGFSFTEGVYAQNAIQVAEDLYIALLQFFQLFPKFKKYRFYIGGQWLAGKYLPELANIIKRENKIKKTLGTTEKINLVGLIMGNALSDPIHQIRYGEHLYQIGLIELAGMKHFMRKERIFRCLIRNGLYNWAYTIFLRMMIESDSMFEEYTGLDKRQHYNYDDQIDTFGALHTRANDYLKSRKLRSIIHVGATPFGYSDDVEEYIKNDFMKSVATLVSDLLEDYEIHYYSGQLDIIINYHGTGKFIDSLKYKDYDQTPRKFNPDINVYSNNIGNLFVDLVVAAGHRTTYDNPEYMYNKINEL